MQLFRAWNLLDKWLPSASWQPGCAHQIGTCAHCKAQRRCALVRFASGVVLFVGFPWRDVSMFESVRIGNLKEWSRKWNVSALALK